MKFIAVEHIVQGGSYFLDHTYVFCLVRKANVPLNRGFDLGFQIVT